MFGDDINDQIAVLVDHLRKRGAPGPNLVEVASVTEVLIATMQAYFRSIDTSIYREFRELSDYIAKARGEIASLRPSDLQRDRLPRAGKELEAIVRSTEEATNKIMAAAEAVMAADPAADDFRTLVSDRCMEIFEACSFQDITGQRISKVVETLTYIEERVGRLKDALGSELQDGPPDEDRRKGDEVLLNGPALEGEGIAQDEVDKLMGDGEAPAGPAKSRPAPAPAPTPGDKVSQADIDALFE
ncbi:protein phosphatase CheZ [Zavarzinia compransoris]|uniref:protein phosphatase CheZ n=1 Tax=Zavarzinia marina TaxID=2911065 RepID=UPI001F18EFEC|nr:protein phosphatase CheZ [Zavarzinia marina]MCF4164722.1 protein phosphatase CheZ [Zavarzinia marina]